MTNQKSKKPSIPNSVMRQELKFFCNISGSYSDLELCIITCQILGVYVRGDLHSNQLLRWVWSQVLSHKRQKSAPVKKKALSDNFYNSRAWQILRYQAFEKYGNKCQCCGASPSDGAVLHVDHIKPKSTHPELALDLRNLQILCKSCNLGKINQFDTDWRGTRTVDEQLDIDALCSMPDHLLEH